MPYNVKHFTTPKVYEQLLKEWIEYLYKLGVLRRCNDSEWGSPCFIKPKKNSTIWFLTYFRSLNKLIKRKPYPIPNIKDMILKLEGFWFATYPDLNMGYNYVKLTPNTFKICTTVRPWGNFEYCWLQLGVLLVLKVFQEEITNIFHRF